MKIEIKNHDSIPVVYDKNLCIANYFYDGKNLVIKIDGEILITITNSFLESQEILLKKIIVKDNTVFLLISSDFEEYLFINHYLIRLGAGVRNFELFENNVYVAYSEEGIFSEFEPSINGVIEYDIGKKYMSTILPEKLAEQIIDIECVKIISNNLFLIAVFENYEHHLIIYDKKNNQIDDIKLPEFEDSIIDLYCTSKNYYFFTLSSVLILNTKLNLVESLVLSEYIPSEISSVLIHENHILFEGKTKYYLKDINTFIDLLEN